MNGKTDLKIDFFLDFKRLYEINLVILLTWIRLRIHKILCIRIRIQLRRIQITGSNYFYLGRSGFINHHFISYGLKNFDKVKLLC